MSYVLFPSTLKPTGLFSTHEDIFGKGGFVSLTGEANNLAEESDIQDFLNTNIIEQRRKLGMLVYISSIKRYYTCSSVTGEAGISGDWDRQYFSGRYFHGPSAPTEQDIQIGERWFDTIAGTEYTYIPIQEGSDQYAWVDIDHLGQDSLSYYYGETPPTGELNLGDKWFNTIVGSEFTYLYEDDNQNSYVWVDIDHIGSGGGGSMIYFYGDDAPTEAIGATIGSKWFNTKLGAELTLLPNEPDNGGETGTVWVMVNSLASGASGDFVLKTGDTMSGTLTADRAFRTSSDNNFSSNEFVTKNYVDGLSPSGDFVLKTGDEMSGTLTGTTASFSNSITAPSGFIGTLAGVNSSFTGLTSTNGFIGTLTGTSSFMDSSMIVSNSLSYENQPVAKIQKIDGNTDEYSGYYPGTTGFMNLPRLVLEHNPSNSWGWPSAIDFVARPTAQSDISSITHRIGNLFSTGGISRLIFWGAPAQNTTYGGGITGISAGLSGEGLTTLGYFQYAVGASDSGFHALKAFRTTEETTFQSNELTTSDYVRKQRPFEMYITLTKGSNDTSSYDAVGSNWNVVGFTNSLTGTIPEPDSGDALQNRGSRYTILTEEMVGFARPWKINVKRSFVRHRHTIVEITNNNNEYPMIIMPNRGGAASMKWHTQYWSHGGSYGNNDLGYTGDYPPEWNGDERERGAWAMRFPPEPTSWINEFSVSNSDVIVRWNGYLYDYNACSWFNYDNAKYESASLVNDVYYNPGLDTENSVYTSNVEMQRIKIATITDYDSPQSPFSESNPFGEKMTSLNTGDAYIIQITVYPEES